MDGIEETVQSGPAAPNDASARPSHANAREAALREVLQVISQSRDDQVPVFDTILSKAAELCDAPMARLHLVADDRTSFSVAAFWGEPPRTMSEGEVWPLDPSFTLSRTLIDGETLHLEDHATSENYLRRDPVAVRIVEEEGIRTRLSVPLMQGDLPIGAITLSRREVKPFNSDQISLVETFAAQAVIAIENVRQFRELQTRLEREAATREILSVISQCRDDEKPVFDVILKQAALLCRAPQAGLIMPNEARTHARYIANWGPPSKYFEVGVTEWPIEAPIAITTAIRESRVVNIPDLLEDAVTKEGDSSRLEIIDKEGIRSVLAVPLISGGRAIGCFDVYRLEVEPFTEDEVSLIQSFAAQAVIAIENVRQFRELQARFEREKASAKILELISQSRDDDQPVFETILQNAARLCKAPQARLHVVTESGTHFRLAATWGQKLATFDVGEEFPVDRPQIIPTAIREVRAIHVEDISQDRLYSQGDPIRKRLVDVEGIRTYLTVPLVSGDRSFGSITLSRREVKPFTDDQIALVESFAAQAVIAIENVRQFKALESRTEEIQALNISLESRVEDQVGEIERMGRLKRFLPAAVADTVISSGSDKMLSSHRALLGVLFCDIRGFTAFCETAEPEETIEVLQTYHQEMGRLINDHGAGVDHRMGDGIMVLFNDPLPCEDPAGEAVRLALAMRDRMEELCKSWKRLGHRLGFGVGVSLGYATVGMVGYEGRYDYTASGTAVNIAARLCDHAEDGEILLSPRAWTAVEDRIETTSRGEVSFKGINREIEVMCIEPGAVLTE